MSKQTAVEFLLEKFKSQNTLLFADDWEQAKEMEKEQMIEFHKWMRENDTAQNAEKHFHFTDSDMLHEYYNETFNK